MTMVLPAESRPAAHPGVSCRHLRLLAAIDRPAVWDARIARLLAAGRRRWHGRTDFDACPSLRQWDEAGQPPTPLGHPTLFDALAAAAAGETTPGENPRTELATAIMLLAGCPAVVTALGPAPVFTKPHALAVSLFVLPADDLDLARDLVQVAVDAAGTIVFRSDTTVTLPRPGDHGYSPRPLRAAAS
ncbi:hypothetical protein [Nocardia blacklockiae]|uniref:hypothetical protein n=1 Tax=Nocardia blacklockiae TaxID=480036 RepID=UPI0018959F26|nr:hypothetical protein [Nocardia blacklockiae]MBF6170949.1 hypothetical protein [Nocardia blacklockiae]